ncbi:Sterol 3-beta-glucosyltransferase UGT80A2 [Morella rubra]|uniref:Sterol 3-beta-glucosyltransferase UGT80A2 n=1 Tax=Morella rubra TaxID=262757 RepID=A0A6A1WJA7_9ROSI|nr:Sterol 3-beta-glucosyltransferase UGT80A2 [Morella rubra]
MADNRHHRHCFSDGSTDVSIELERLPATIDGNVVVSSSAEGVAESNSPTKSVPGEALAVEKSDPSSSSSELSGSKKNHTLGLLAAKFFDKKIPLKKKLKWLKRAPMVKEDGTVQFEVPGDIEPQSLIFGAGVVYDEGTDAEPVEEVQNIPPLQIVMLIVGTRGDVQPFVAIGKRLQVIIISWF